MADGLAPVDAACPGMVTRGVGAADEDSDEAFVGVGASDGMC